MDQTGTVLDGRYRLVGQVGMGGTAVVYRAVDERLGRTVAIKILRPHLAQDAAYLGRFVQEAQRAAQVSHPNIATVLDVNATGSEPYMVMEFIDGVPLSRLAPLPIGDAIELVRQASDALGFLHRNQLVHGDVKPDNLLVRQDGRVKLVDFGIARPIGDRTTALVMGSPAYVAPERLQGAPLTPLADIYGLGTALFEALTGRPPFVGTTAQEVAAQTLSAEPPALLSIRPDIPIAVEGIVARAMAKDPKHRFGDMDQFGLALAGLQMSAGQVTGPLPVQRPPQAAPPPARPPQSAIPAPIPSSRPATPQRPVQYTPPVGATPQYGGGQGRPPGPPTGATAAQPSRDNGLSRSILLLLVLLVILGLGITGLTVFRNSLRANLPTTPTLTTGGAPTSQPTQPDPAPTATQSDAPKATNVPKTAPTIAPTRVPASPTARPPSPTPSVVPPTATSVPPTATPITPTAAPPTATPVRVLPTATAARLVVVPPLFRMTENDARRALEAVGLRLGRVEMQESEAAPNNRILRQSVEAGERVPIGTAIDIVIARRNVNN